MPCYCEVDGLKLAGEIIGVVAIIEGFFIYYSAKRERMLIFKFISDALWLCNLLLLGGITGAILNVISMLRETVFYFRDKRRFANSIFWPILFMLAAAVSPVLSLVSGKESWYAVLPALGSMVAVLAFYQRRPGLVRLFGSFSQSMWLLYAIFMLNYSSIVCNTVLLLSAVAGGVRALCQRRREEESQA